MDKTPRRPLVARREDLEDFTDVVPAPSTGDSAVAAAEGPTAAFSFTGKRGELFRIALVNAVLTLLTLGIYRFWAKTKIRRYFWSNIRANNEPLEYTGTAMELLIGFLVVLAILVPLFALYQGALFVAGSAPEWVTTSLNIVYGFVLLAFFQYAFYRMWRYRFSRTTWRGVRFGQAGSAWKYVGITLLWMLVTLVTLNMAFPWLRNAQWKYRISNLHFGETAVTFSGAAKPLFVKWLMVNLIPSSVLLVGIILYHESLFQLYQQLQPGADQDPVMIQSLIQQVGPFLITWVIASLYGVVAFIWYRVKEANYVIGHCQIGGATFDAHIRTASIYSVIVIYIVFAILMIVAAALLVKVLGTAFGSAASVFLIIGIMVFGVLIGIQILSVLVLNYGIAANVFSDLKINNSDALTQVSQGAAKKPEFGEGLADALDVGAF